MFEYPYTLKGKEVHQLDVVVNNRNHFLHYKISATNIVKVFVVNNEGLSNIRNGKPFYAFNKIRKNLTFDEKVPLPNNGLWFLVLFNPNTDIVSYDCEIYA